MTPGPCRQRPSLGPGPSTGDSDRDIIMMMPVPWGAGPAADSDPGPGPVRVTVTVYHSGRDSETRGHHSVLRATHCADFVDSRSQQDSLENFFFGK
jgi:hypothetical protein